MNRLSLIESDVQKWADGAVCLMSAINAGADVASHAISGVELYFYIQRQFQQWKRRILDRFADTLIENIELNVVQLVVCAQTERASE